MKRFLATLLTLILLVGILPAQQAEAAVTTATVKGGWLRLRNAPSFDAETIASYYTGTKMTVLGTKGAWYHVSAPDGYTGYMYGSYLSIGSSSGNENIAATVVSSNGLDVRLRSGPSTAYGVIGLYPVGTKATILSSGTYWHYVSIGGTKGYMMSQYLSVSGSSVTPPSTDSYTAYVTSKNGLGVRLRSGAGTGYGVLGVYSVGTPVTVLKHNTTWDYIRVGSRTGYMMNEFLTTASVPTPPVDPGSYTAYVTSANGLPVKLRSGAGSGYGVIAKYPVGTVVTVLEHNATWDYIRIKTADGYVTGYMMNQFLTSTAVSKKISGVTLNTEHPVPGDTLYANVTPVDAQVSYEWANDSGVLLSTSASYTVRKDDVGSKIRVRVIGKNGYTGNATSLYATVEKAGTTTVLQSVTISTLKPKVGDTISIKTDPVTDSVKYTWMRDDGVAVGSAKAYTVQPGDAGHYLYCQVQGTGSVAGTITSAWTYAVEKPAEPEKPAEKTPLNGVSLNNTRPKVGDTLTAKPDPITENAVYTWVREGGVVLGSGSSYTVQAGDAGYAIQCVAAGLGDMTGTVYSAWTSPVEAAAPVEQPISGTVSLVSAVLPGVELNASVAVNCTDISYAWYADGSLISTSSSVRVSSDLSGMTIKLVVTPLAGSGFTGKVESNGCTVLVSDSATTTDM